MPFAFLHAPIYRKRIEVLTELICPHLTVGDAVLDIGSGCGDLGASLETACQRAGHPITISGLEKNPRGNEKIPTLGFDGYRISAADQAYDVVILADVVHHETTPDLLLAEAARVCRRYLIVKDHTRQGFLAYPRICFMDWAANAPYGVKCLYRYFSIERWGEIFETLGFEPSVEHRTINLYPPVVNAIFGRKLQYLAIAKRREIPAEVDKHKV